MNKTLRLEIGYSRQGVPLSWESRANFHMLADGQSGMGKTYFLVHCLGQMPAQGCHCYVFDYAGDIAEKLKQFRYDFEVLDVSKQISVNPFHPFRLGTLQGEEVFERPFDCAVRISEAILNTYNSRVSTQQLAFIEALTQFISEGQTGTGISGLLYTIYDDDNLTKALRRTVIPILVNLDHVFQSGGSTFNWKLNQPGITVFNYIRIPHPSLQAIITQFLLAELWVQATEVTKGHCPVITVIDECQRFSYTDQSILTRILREGRKYQFHGWFASQWISIDKAVKALNQAAMQAHFFPGEENVTTLARRIQRGDISTRDCRTLIQTLKVGEFIYNDSEGGHIIVNHVPEAKYPIK